MFLFLFSSVRQYEFHVTLSDKHWLISPQISQVSSKEADYGIYIYRFKTRMDPIMQKVNELFGQ